MKIWSDSKQDWEEVEWSEEGKRTLKEINRLARRLELIENYGKKHAVIALIKELTSEAISKAYVSEKLEILFW